MVVDQLHGCFEAVHADDAQHRAEDFLLVDGHLRGDAVEQGAADEEAVLVAGDLVAAAIHQQLGALLDAAVDVAGDLGLRRAGDQRAHVQAAVGAGADLQGLDLRDDLLHQRIGDLVAHAHGHGDGHAALAAGTVGGAHERADGVVEVGVGHQHGVVLRPAQGLHALAALGAFGIDVLGDRGRADEAQGLHFRRLDQRVHGFLVAVHHVQHALRQTGFLEQFGDQQGRARVALGRLEDEGVAAGDGQRVHPQRNHRREVERGDAGDHADRLEVAPGVDIRAYVAAVFALQQFRCGGGVLDVLDAALQLAGGIFDGLAVLFADQFDDALLIGFQQLLEAEQHLRALGRRGVAPGREGGLGGIDSLLHGLAAGQRDLVDGFAGGRVEDVGGAAGVGQQLAVDQVLDGAHCSYLVSLNGFGVGFTPLPNPLPQGER
ncbi:hypothetical protein D3C76_619610 [compost metagenome]